MEEQQTVKRYYIGVDWGDRLHQLYVGDEEGKKVREIKVPETVEGLAEIGRWLDEKEPRDLSCGQLLRSRQDGLWTFCSTTEWRFIR